jgi:hypothetical protein
VSRTRWIRIPHKDTPTAEPRDLERKEHAVAIAWSSEETLDTCICQWQPMRVLVNRSHIAIKDAVTTIPCGMKLTMEPL